MRANLVVIASDKSESKAATIQRLSQYYDAMIDLTLRLDYAAFNTSMSDASLTQGACPAYLPNGFLDLGKDTAESGNRTREKILIDKGSMLAKLKPFMIGAIVQATEESRSGDSEDIKRRIAIKIGTWLAQEITFDNKRLGDLALILFYYVSFFVIGN